MTNRAVASVLTLLLLLFYCPPAASAQISPSFTLTASEAYSEVGQDVRVIVTGEDLQDMFGFEIHLTYDESKLKLKSVKSSMTGFSVPVNEEEGEILFAHTKIGRTQGESGRVEMAEITFKMIAAGKASVELDRVKLVSSEIITKEPKADVRLDLEITQPLAVFKDISGHWAKENIERAALLGFVDGYPDGTFRPQEAITRAEFTAILVRAASMPQAADKPLGFTDLSEIPSWAMPAVVKAVSAGIVAGYEDNTFRASKQITRAEMAVMVMRTLGVTTDSGKTTSFADANKIPVWAHASIAHAVEEGIVQGRGNNLFAPNANATRAEALTMILTLYDYNRNADSIDRD